MNTTYPPVVSVLGHVDHGKTSLLDAIRKTNIASGEHGGITQKIGASSVEIQHDGKKRKITFIDTPGHAAFSHMRGRGARVADIGIFVVYVVDGVMPETKESIEILKQSDAPFVVALTKADTADKNPEKVKQQLAKEEVMVEGYGGDIPVLEVSSKTGLNVKELLDTVLLLYDIKYPLDPKKTQAPLEAVVIESRLDSKAGPKATVVIKNGTIRVKDEVVSGSMKGKVRALINDKGVQVKEASVGDAIEILGFEEVPGVGSVIRLTGENLQNDELKTLEKDMPEGTSLSVILCADTKGSLEAITYSFPEGVYVRMQKTGEVSEADVLLAKSTGSIVLCFNTKIRPDVLKFAMTEKVLLKNYTIIYELLTEVKDALEGKQLAGMEQIFGVAQIQATFPFEKSTVLGIKIIDGRIAKGDKIRIMRDEVPFGESHIVSVRQGKNPTSKVEAGQEAGILISPFLDIHIGDVILSHS